jgi:hypothetical protein
VKVVAGADVRRHIEDHGGAVYVWPKGTGCCRGRTFVLECATERPNRDLELVHAADGFQIYATLGLAEPEELHLELARRGAIRAYWNGQAWIG